MIAGIAFLLGIAFIIFVVFDHLRRQRDAKIVANQKDQIVESRRREGIREFEYGVKEDVSESFPLFQSRALEDEE